MQLPKHYDPKEVETKWQKYWEKNNIFAFDKKSKLPIYSVDTPPPTVSGKMHLGHSFSYSQQDFIVRFKRMSGNNVFYPFGTDDNGLPTKLLIEKEKHVRANDMSRKEFTKLVLKTLKEELRPKYIADWKKIGMSCDFNMFYTTINEHCQKISQKSFIDLYKAGREYRTEAAAMYCPKCQTAISQVECEDKDIHSAFNDIVFKTDKKDLIISTTRPELLSACVAVFYHPTDKRYQKLKGKTAKVPVFDYEVPILEDEKADPEKGTGIVMCCTFGDSTDADWQKAHKLPIREAIDKQGRMTELAGKYKGMKIEEARKAIIEDMKESNLLIKQEPITHAVNTHERCGTPIEFIHSKQWFIKYLDLKKDMLKWGKELNWYPEHMRNRYENWVKGLQWDWCISRQLPYGIPFPVWYCEDCDEIILAKEDSLPVDPTEDAPPVKQCPKCKGKKIIPEKDIINTWATSSLTPQIAASLVPEMYDKLYPMTMRPQAHDIISFWLFNTVVKSQLHNKKNPWKDCVISGWALDPHGKKMSKSKGNVIEPQVMIDKYSADCLRFWAAGSKLGEDLPFQEKDLVTGQKFITKFWNASKFAIMHLEDYKKTKPKLEAFDRWFLIKLNNLIKTSTESFEKYEFSRTKADTEKFFWQTLCDNYLEIAKDRLYNPDKRGKESRQSAQFALYNGVLTCLKLMAPITPHFTEEIFHLYFADKSKSIHLTDWPKYDAKLADKKTESAGDLAVNIIIAVRKLKADSNISLGKEIKKLIIKTKDKKSLEPFLDDLKSTTRADEIKFEGKADVDISEDLKIGILA
ncbi:valine--tRNA ligase [Candidatus Woesearchaeota archaeon]|nr:valine--tRNA ligase [Candidatus Woesearchaeota archaeon]